MRQLSVCRAAAVALTVALAGCGGTAGEPSTASRPARATQRSAPASSAASLPAAPAAQASAASPASATGDSVYADLPQSKTPQGYFVLGDPGAPVTLTFYSDFI